MQTCVYERVLRSSGYGGIRISRNILANYKQCPESDDEDGPFPPEELERLILYKWVGGHGVPFGKYKKLSKRFDLESPSIAAIDWVVDGLKNTDCDVDGGYESFDGRFVVTYAETVVFDNVSSCSLALKGFT